MNRFIFILILFSCCNCSSIQSTADHSFYYDMDIFNMKGKQVIKEKKPIPPCFEIDSLGAGKIRLTFWHSDKDKYSRDYIMENNYWKSSYPLHADTLDLIAYNLIDKNRFIQLEYEDDSAKDNLRMATVWKDSLEKVYLFKPFFRVKPAMDIDFDNSKFDEQTMGVTTVEYHVKNGNLQVVRTSITILPERTIRDTANFKIEDHSIFWWREFGK